MVFITEMKCLLHGTNWVFKQSSLRFVFQGLIILTRKLNFPTLFMDQCNNKLYQNVVFAGSYFRNFPHPPPPEMYPGSLTHPSVQWVCTRVKLRQWSGECEVRSSKHTIHQLWLPISLIRRRATHGDLQVLAFTDFLVVVDFCFGWGGISYFVRA